MRAKVTNVVLRNPPLRLLQGGENKKLFKNEKRPGS